MPRQAREPCSGWGLVARMAATSAAVAGPVVSAHAISREGVQSGVGAVGVGHVGGVGRVLPPAPEPPIRGHAPPLENELDGGPGEPRLDALAQKLVGDRVVVVLDGDVVIDVDGGVAPLGEFVGVRGRGRSAGRSRRSKSSRRETPSCFRGRVLSPTRSSWMAALSSARLKKRRWRRAARITRWAMSTLASTTALSRACPLRAGTTAAP